MMIASMVNSSVERAVLVMVNQEQERIVKVLAEKYGFDEDEAMAMIVRGFVEPIARELPMEYALELNRLIELQMEGAVG